MRQDRIGDPTERDWDKLGLTWVGKHIEEDFWWHIVPEESEVEDEEQEEVDEEERDRVREGRAVRGRRM